MTTTEATDDWDNAEPVRMPWKWRLFLTVLFLQPILYFAWEGDHVLAAVCAVSGFMAFGGFRLGAIAILSSIGAIAAAIHYAPSIGCAQEFRFTEWFGTTGLLNRGLSIGVVGVAITLGITGVAAIIVGGLVRQRPVLDRVNRWTGFGIGLVEGLALCLFFLGGMLVIEPTEQARAESPSDKEVVRPLLARAIATTTEQTRASRLGPVIEQYNPFVRFPSLNKVEEIQKSVQVLSDPREIDGLMNHPSMRQLRQRPEIRAVVEKLHDDPEIRKLFQSGRPMDRLTAMTLLSHPVVLELLDQPGFTEEAARVLREANGIAR